MPEDIFQEDESVDVPVEEDISEAGTEGTVAVEEDIFNHTVQTDADIPQNPVVNEYRSKITIGDVETLDYGEDAYVTNTGTAEDPILNFGLPQGASGTIWGQLNGQLSDQADLQDALDAKDAAIALKADIASPALTGTPTAPTAVSSTNNTQIATTAFVQNAISILNTSLTASLQSYVQSYVSTAVANMLQIMDFGNAVQKNFVHGSYSYTVPKNGYIIYIGATHSHSVLTIAGKKVADVGTGESVTNDTHFASSGTWFPVASGKSVALESNPATGTGNIQILFVPFKS